MTGGDASALIAAKARNGTIAAELDLVPIEVNVSFTTVPNPDGFAPLRPTDRFARGAPHQSAPSVAGIDCAVVAELVDAQR